jgi:hypothetical protein
MLKMFFEYIFFNNISIQDMSRFMTYVLLNTNQHFFQTFLLFYFLLSELPTLNN